MSKKRSLIAVLMAAVISALVFGVVSRASAHTPAGGADCEKGVYAQGTSYESSDTNTLTVSVDDHAVSKQFDSEGYLSLPIPQDGVQHTWSWSVSTTNENPAYSGSDHGVITCGEQTTPPPPVYKRASVLWDKSNHCGWRHDKVRIREVHNVSASSVTRVNHRRWVIRATANPDARFADGSSHYRKVTFTPTKGTNCHRHINGSY